MIGALKGRRVKTRLVLLLVLGSSAYVCHAEPRWCSVVGGDPSNKLIYPPIAKAARVSGPVTSRMVYVPNGRVVRVEPIWGPRLLSQSVSNQLMNWTVMTDALGDELCETLVIADFRLNVPGELLPTEPLRSTPPSVLRLSVEGQVLVISDPGAELTWSPFGRLRYKLKRAIKSAFRSNNSD
jgi:hypothetical protein